MFRAATVIHKEGFSRRTGRRMGLDLTEKLEGRPHVAWLFCSPHRDIRDLIKGINDVMGTAALIGCTTDGEISEEGASAGAAVLGGVFSPKINVEFVCAASIGQDSFAAGERLGRQLSETVSCIHLFSDGLTGNGSALLQGLESAVGNDIPVVGGTAGDAGRFAQTWQFFKGKILSDAAVAVGLSGDFKTGCGVKSGWSPIGIAKKITRSAGNMLYELNDEPALDVYERFLGKHARKLPEVGVEYPLLIETPAPDGRITPVFRATMAVHREEGAISFAGDIAEGATAYLTCGDMESILRAAEEATKEALAAMGDATPVMAFCYSCMARKIVLGRHIGRELACVKKEIPESIPILGFYTYGEYGRAGREGINLLHNETVSISVIGM